MSRFWTWLAVLGVFLAGGSAHLADDRGPNHHPDDAFLQAQGAPARQRPALRPGDPRQVHSLGATRLAIGRRTASSPLAGGHISGTVTEEGTGTPLTAEYVQFFDAMSTYFGFSAVDGAGVYVSPELAAGTYYAIARSNSAHIGELYDNVSCPGGTCNVLTGNPITVTAGATTAGIDFALAPGGRITGTVTNASLAPLANVDVNIYDEFGVALTSGRTNSSGVYISQRGLVSGTYYAVTSNSLGYLEKLYNNIDCPHGSCSATSGTPISVTVGLTTTGIDFALTQGGRITGTLTDAGTALPLINTAQDLVEVQIYNSGGSYVTSGQTNSSGVYTSNTGLLSGTYYAVTSNSLGYFDELYDNFSCFGSGCLPTDGTAIIVTEGATTAGKDFALTLGGRISGTVRDATSLPLADVAVNIYDASGNSVTYGLTNSSGVYTSYLGLVSGNYYVATSNSLGYFDELYNNIPCSPCDVTTGTPVAVTQGSVTPNINFALDATLSIGGTAVLEGQAGTTDATFTVTLSPPRAQTVTVDYATSNGTATAGSDYTAASGTLTFTPQQTTQTITVAVHGDVVVEPDETFAVTLSNPTNAVLGPGGAPVDGTILNDDPTLIVTATTGGHVTSSPGSIDCDASGAACSELFGEGTPVTLTAAPTTGNTFVGWGGACSGAALTCPVTMDASKSVTAAFEQPRALSISDASVSEGNSGTVPATFTVSLSAPSAGTVTVNWATSNGTATAGVDYVAASGTLTFTPGVISQPITVTVNGDTTYEPNETFTVTLSAPAGATITDGQGLGTITNDDAVPTLSISDASVAEGNSGSSTATFTATMSNASATTVTVNWATSDGTAVAGVDYVAASGTLTFTPGVTSQPIPVTVNGDTTYEADETFTVTLSGPAGATIADGQGAGTITNDDTAPTLSISDASVSEGNSGTAPATFTVSLSAASGVAVTVDWATSNGTATAGEDYVAASGTLTFTPGVTSQPIPVTVNGDTTYEPDETFTVTLSVPVGATIADGQGTGTITNDDTAPTLSISDASVLEGNSGTGPANFTVALSAASGVAVTVNWATSDGTATAGVDYVAASGTLTFNPGVTSQPIPVTVNGDTTYEPDETFTVTLSGPVGATIADSQGLGTITNDDAPPVTTEPVVWTSLVGVSATGNNLTKTAAAGWNAGAISTQQLVSGDGYVEITASETTTNRLFGLSNGNTNESYQDIDFAIYQQNGGSLEVRESGTSRGIFGTYVAGDLLRVAVEGGVVKYKKNGTVLYTSSVTPTYPLLVDTAFHSQGATITSAVVSNWSAVVWTSLVGVSATGNSLTKTAAAGWNAGAISTQQLASGDGYVEVTASETTTNRLFGLSNGNTNESYQDIDFAIYQQNGGSLEVRESGTSRGIFGTYVAGDLLRVAVEGGVVKYKRNGTVLYTSSVTPTYPLLVDTAFHSQGATITSAVISNWSTALPTLSISDASVSEGDSGSAPATFTVSLSAASAGTVTVNWATSNGTAVAGVDYVAASGTLTFNPGVTSQPIPVTVNGDTTYEPDETFTVTLSAPVGATIADGQGTGTITNDDAAPTLSISDATVTEGNSGSAPATFTVSLSAASGVAVTVNWATSNGTATAGVDYVAASGTLTFNPGGTSQPIPVTVNGDTTSEPDETFTVTLSSPVGATLADGQALGTITNDDAPPVTDEPVVWTSLVGVSATGNSLTKTAAAGWNAGAVSTQQLLSSDGYVEVTASETTTNRLFGLSNGNTNESYQDIDFAIYQQNGGGLEVRESGTSRGLFGTYVAGDVLRVAVEGGVVKYKRNGTVLYTSSLNPIYPLLVDTAFHSQGATITSAVISNWSTAPPTLSISDASVSEGNSGTAPATFTVSLSAASAGTVTVNWATSNGTAVAGVDYVAASGTLTFNPGVTSQPIPVTVNGDTTYEPDETFTVTLSGPVGATIGDGQGLGTITNDDASPVTAVVWTSLVGVSATGNSLTKTATAGWNAGAISTQQLVSGDGYVEVTASETTTNRLFGLSNGNTNESYQDIDFAIYQQNGGSLEVRESGTSRGIFGTYIAGDLLRVAVEGGVVKYKKNGTVLYTSGITPTYPLLVDTAFHSQGATITSAVVSNWTVGVVWTSLVGVSATGNSLTKTAAAGWNAGAVSTQQLVSGDGYVEVTASETTTNRLFGLSNGNTNESYQDIDFAIYQQNGGALEVRESGTSRGVFGTYVTGDLLRVAVEGGVVQYKRNGTVLYTSSITPTYPLLVDTAFHSQGATITSALVSNPVY